MSEKHTPTPWEWRYFDDKLALVCPKHGTLIVMDFIRKGMNSAQPRFAERKGNEGGLMMKAEDIDITKHPDARFICLAANNYEALVDFIEKVANLNFNDYEQFSKSQNYEDILNLKGDAKSVLAEIEKEKE